jgi:AraC-like DNA-binding protein
MISCLWVSVAPEAPASAPARLVLPDGCSDIIWEEGTGACVAGPDTGPVRTQAGRTTILVGARFRPAAGGQALGIPLSELRDQRVPLSDLPGARAAGRLSPDLPPRAAATRVADLAGRLIADAAADPLLTRAAALLGDPAARIEDVAGRLGLSERQFRRRSHAAAGYGPKTLQRILRFQRFIRLLDAAAELPDLAGAAAQAGYADQPHLTRDCGELSGLTPAALYCVRRPMAKGAIVSGA